MFGNNQKEQNISPEEQEIIRKETETIKKEEKRKEIEKYVISEVNFWWILGSIILWLIIGGYLVVDFFINEKSINWYILFLFGLISFPLFTLTNLADKWERILKCKEKISEKEKNYPFSPDKYLYEHFYTDSILEFYIYKLAKIITYLITLLVIIGMGILIFIWLGSISIAPTTIIIILLIIIVAQKSEKHH